MEIYDFQFKNRIFWIAEIRQETLGNTNPDYFLMKIPSELAGDAA